jgi:hypothetical protein
MGKIHKILLVIIQFLTSYGKGRKREEFVKYVKIGNYFSCFLLIEAYQWIPYLSPYKHPLINVVMKVHILSIVSLDYY